MNFGQVVKKEIFSKPPKELHCKKAFLAGLIRGSGEIFTEDGELGFQFRLPSDEVAIEVASLFNEVFGYEVREVTVNEDKLNKKDNFVISVSGARAAEILTALGVLTVAGGDIAVNLRFYGETTASECCLRAFIRGLFAASGSCVLPGKGTGAKTGYHLEMVFSHYTPALETSEKLATFGVMTKITRRKENYVLYIKSAEEIKNFIAFLPAPVSVLKITDYMISRGLSNNSNRQKNCDLGNVNRQIEAAEKSLAAVKLIDKKVGLASLKDALRETAAARRDYPEDSIAELSERLGITKSCLNHRLRKLIEISRSL